MLQSELRSWLSERETISKFGTKPTGSSMLPALISPMDNFHTSVLLQTAIDGLKVRPGGKYIDATAGGGGHTALIISRGGSVLGIDTDADAINYATGRLEREFGTDSQWQIVYGNFQNLGKIATENGFDRVDGILLDLGVSSYQLDQPQRGFSYRFSREPLDLRLDQNQGDPAWVYITQMTVTDLTQILATYGEEELAPDIARAIIQARQRNSIQTTGDLAKIIESVSGTNNETKSRVFQAIRIFVNNELTVLKSGLEATSRLLVPGGRLVVISFHSLEDRIVKQFMAGAGWKQITKKPIRPGFPELKRNKRSRSAKLRIAEKL